MTKEQAITRVKHSTLYTHDRETADFIIKALEQQSSEDLINQVNEQGNKKLTNWLDNFFKMESPKTFDEFANDYGFIDYKEIYTNGSHLIPVFRVKQWLDHIEQQPSDDKVSLEVYKQVVHERDIAIEQLKELGYEFGEKIRTSDDCVSRQAVLDCLTATGLKKFDFILDAREKVNNLSSVISTQGMCKDCEQSQCLGEECYCNNVDEYFDKEFYCADFKRRE